MKNFDYELRLLIIYPKKGNKIQECLTFKQFLILSLKSSVARWCVCLIVVCLSSLDFKDWKRTVMETVTVCVLY
jgi:hypothetical protein